MGGPPLSGLGDRSVSPVVGVVLLVAIVVLLVAAAGTFVFGLADQQTPAPTAKLSLEPIADSEQYALVHHSGDRIDGTRVTVRGVDDPDTLAGEELVAGTEVPLLPRRETIRLVWQDGSDDPSSYILAEFDLDPGAVVEGLGDGTVFTGSTAGVRAVEGDGGSVTTIPNTDTVEAIGAIGPDVSGDGTEDIPYVDGSETVGVVDAEGEVTELASSSDIGGSIETSKTRLATGRWDGQPRSVFFVDQNHDELYRVAPGSNPQIVATPPNGAQAVTGIGDIDGDGSDELVFADASQHLRYLESDGSITKIDDAGSGSNNGIGAGSLADLDGDGTPAVVLVDGSNEILINRKASGGGTERLTGVSATKAPLTTADVDGDGATEIVYVGTTNGKLRFVDDPLGTPSVEVLSDENGNDVDGSDETGAT
ncbi:type IV pilin [Halomicrobium mukohataei]|uniref:Type IV pilin n=1 Tax=Halomicrobium mukohataei TaxID=57705 RepID=A0A847U633_9EURY|nr:VCBS repeat-containing protein [Halomicrobium mukohataei]NLV08469.1 type IV pilin [Halomicrobium mukohataei]